MVCHPSKSKLNRTKLLHQIKKDRYTRTKKRHTKKVHFVEGQYYLINCPVCNRNNRVLNVHDQHLTQNVKCYICEVNQVNVYLPQCGHTCICSDCLIDLANHELLPCTVTIIPHDLGSCRIYRCHLNGSIDCLVMGSDDWGQYDDVMLSRYYQFIEGYSIV